MSAPARAAESEALRLRTRGGHGGRPKQNAWSAHQQIPARTAESDALSKDLIRRGFKFVGSTICYAFMQAVGMVNDHTTDCFRHQQIRRR